MRFDLLNHWFICDNEMSISLIKYFVKIEIGVLDETLLYKLKVYKDGIEEKKFLFNTLESAITFTEDVINKDYYITLEDIEDVYFEYYGDSKLLKYRLLNQKHKN